MRIVLVFLILNTAFFANRLSAQPLERDFQNPPATAKPWVFWYWMHGAVSRPGITADLEVMKQVGIGGAYLMPIKDTSPAIPFAPVVRQLTPEWWRMVSFAVAEAKRLNLALGLHLSDGFALAGGPWITPELSMQKLVWSKTFVNGANAAPLVLPPPAALENYYKDIAVFAFPANRTNGFHPEPSIPSVTTSYGTKADFLALPNGGNETFRSDTGCWIQYRYDLPFTCRNIKIHAPGSNYQARRLSIETSADGKVFSPHVALDPPRHGWQDGDEDVTYAIPPVTARFFRLVFAKAGSEPGAEDLDAAKWNPTLKVQGIYLSGEPVIHQFESKNGSVWRVGKNTSSGQLPDSLAVPLDSIINLTGKMDARGHLQWTAPAGDWVIVRIGHTSTGHTNYTGGGGLGLECDKFNPAAVKLQFRNWFARAFEQPDAAAAREVIQLLHIDSWECGSQNWSDSFPAEFKKRRGYDLMPYMLAMTGVPVQNAATSEQFLHDVRQTIAELVNAVFYGTLKEEAHAMGVKISAESVAPTMMSDGLLHYQNADLPMGEFWLNSPTHDKPNDMMDAISGAHIYGKNIIQAEAFTTVRMDWSEHPGALKITGDRNFALGINKMVLHVFAHNPWMDKMPGMTLDGVGLYFQRNQTWFKQGKAWIDYLSRCQALLQRGKPVTDLAVFTGEQLPRRAILPDRLVNTLPGIFGPQKLEAESLRLQNKGQPLRQIPEGVMHSANMADPGKWIDPLNGYSYDSFNPDALMMMTVKNGKLILPGGASYEMLVFPGPHAMNPNPFQMSVKVAKQILYLLQNGAKIMMGGGYAAGIGLNDQDAELRLVMNEILTPRKNGQLILTPYRNADFTGLGIEKDVDFKMENNPAGDHVFAWTHRREGDRDIYFISNQSSESRRVKVKFRQSGKTVQAWDAVTAGIRQLPDYARGTYMDLELPAAGSCFFVFKKQEGAKAKAVTNGIKAILQETPLSLAAWTIKFDPAFGGPAKPVAVNALKSWPSFADSAVRYYSGTAIYTTSFEWKQPSQGQTFRLKFDSVYNLATVKLNGINCGTLWTPPYVADLSKAMRQGVNHLEVEVTNTWHNRLIRDNALEPKQRITFTTAPFRLAGKPLLPAGIVGGVTLLSSKK